MEKRIFRVIFLFILSCGITLAESSSTGSSEVVQFPSGPAGPGPFGAYYTRLTYTPEWDQSWRVGDHPDVVVRFEDSGSRLIFWRGMSYIPCWVTENNIWYMNEFCETVDEQTTSSQEPLSDRYCLFSHVRVIENTSARVVIHWRYALSDYDNKLAHKDPKTGWHDMADEYYYIYPNGVAMRKIILYSSRLDLWHEFQESIVINPPGVMPDDQIESDAITLANLKGESKTFRWEQGVRVPEPDWLGQPENACIEVINLKSENKPFLIVPPEKTRIVLLRTRGSGESRFYCWQGPVRQLNMTRPLPARARSFDQTTHVCLSRFVREDDPKDTFGWQPYTQTEQSITKLMLNGMTNKSASELAKLGRSWLRAPKVQLHSTDFTSEGYDPTQLAYCFWCTQKPSTSALKFTMLCNVDSPVCDPAIIIRNWGDDEPMVKIDGKTISSNKDFRIGHHKTLEGTDLILWLRFESTITIHMEIFTQ